MWWFISNITLSLSFIALSFVVNLMWWFKVVIYFYDIETYRIQISYVDFMIVLWYNNLCFTWFRIIVIKIVQNVFFWLQPCAICDSGAGLQESKW